MILAHIMGAPVEELLPLLTMGGLGSSLLLYVQLRLRK